MVTVELSFGEEENISPCKTEAAPRPRNVHHLNSPSASLPTLHKTLPDVGQLLAKKSIVTLQNRSQATAEEMLSPRFTIGQTNILPRLLSSRNLDVPLPALVPRSRLDLKGLICHT